MPALTLQDQSPFPDEPSNIPPARDTPNPYPRPALPRPHRHTPNLYSHSHLDTSAAHPHYDRSYHPLLSSSSMFSYFTIPQQPTNWHPHLPLLHNNPYPPPQPPQLVHKVWILDCRSCGTFLTNRGMKAVLLLRPNVSLFSTDALPVNCSAYSTNPDALSPPCRPFTSSSSPRTCECLTQTLCCHTCGTAVGYMIVIPCARCTSSISTTNRATNGHRFVFHSSEITASERHHILDEPGVLPVEYSAPPPPSSPPPLAPAYPTIFHPHDVQTQQRFGNSTPSHTLQPPQPSSPSSGPDFLSPRTESPDWFSSSSHSSPRLVTSVPPTSPRRSPRPLQAPFPLSPARRTPLETRGATPELLPRKLKAGDVLFWHHLAKQGEIPGVQEDPRARMPNRGNALKFLER